VSDASITGSRLQSLARCRDPASLRAAVITVCAEFGQVTRIEIFTLGEADKRRAYCLVRLESPAQERELRATLGAAWFGDDLLIAIDLPDSEAAEAVEEARFF
jgi:hypothetical protein